VANTPRKHLLPAALTPPPPSMHTHRPL
jgi:hypothetical protein